MKKEYKELEIWLRLFEADIVTMSDNQKDDVADDIFNN